MVCIPLDSYICIHNYSIIIYSLPKFGLKASSCFLRLHPPTLRPTLNFLAVRLTLLFLLLLFLYFLDSFGPGCQTAHANDLSMWLSRLLHWTTGGLKPLDGRDLTAQSFASFTSVGIAWEKRNAPVVTTAVVVQMAGALICRGEEHRLLV